MVTVADDLDTIILQEPIFKDVRYYLSGDVSGKILQLLQSGGAENTKYFSDYVTHLICGQNVADTDLDDAQDIYQIPAVTEHWVIACIRLKRLANPTPYLPSKNKIFTNVNACITKVSPSDAKSLFALITYHGGKVQLNLNNSCTHLICGLASGSKYNAALGSNNRIKIVTPDWVLDSLKARIQAAVDIYHPRLLVIPSPPQKPMDRISAITGFDFEEGIAKNEVPTHNIIENKDETQALLDKLKQRMPWNHPPSNTSTVTAVSNVTSVGYNTSPMSSSSILTKSIPQGIVTQNVQIQGTQSSSSPLVQKYVASQGVAQAGVNAQNQQINIQLQQQQAQIYNQNQQQPHGLTAIQIQQQKLLQQHQIKMQMLQNKGINQQNQQGFSTTTNVTQMNQNVSNQLQPHMQNQHQIHTTHNLSQSPTNMTSAQQQIENISQMLSQSANNLQQAQLNQKNIAMKQNLSLSQQSASQAVQNIAQQLAQSTQNLQQSLQNAKMNQGLGQGQVMSQQLMTNSQQLAHNPNILQQQQQPAQSITNQQQNMNIGVANQQGQLTIANSQSQSAQPVQLNQLLGNSNQQPILSQQIQTVQQNIQGQQNVAWRQQNIQMVQNVQGQHQIIRSSIVQPRNSQNQVILQQQILQSQQQNLINNQQQPSSQHNIQQGSQQILQQTISSQGQPISQPHHQILVQKQQLLSGSGQQIVQSPQQVLINQHTGQQQILVHGNQQLTLQSGQQIVSQGQLIHQGGQVVNQGQQILTQGAQQVLSQGQHVITQQGQQHQVVIAQSAHPIVSQGQQIIGQSVGQGQQVISQTPQGTSQLSGGGIQQIITHSGGQQIISSGGQQIMQGGQGVTWQQQQYLQQRQQIGQQTAVGPRVSWSGAAGGRQLIHLDAQTHAQLQQMDPQQRALFVAQIQKRRQLHMQRATLTHHQGGVVGAAGGGPSVTFIRSQLPPNLTHQHQVQWLQQGTRVATAPAAAAPPQSPDNSECV